MPAHLGGRFDLPPNAERRVRSRNVVGWRWRIHIARTKQADAARTVIVEGHSRGFRKLSLDARSELQDIGEFHGRVEPHDTGWTRRAEFRIRRICDHVLEQLHSVETKEVKDWSWSGSVVKHAPAAPNHSLMLRARRPRDGAARSEVV